MAARKAPSEADKKIVDEAHKRFRRCEEYEADTRVRFVADAKFANADSDNGWQWPSDVKSERDQGGRPCLTINKTRQHALQVINDARQNKAGIEVRPIGSGATYEAAKVLEGVIRHIEYISNAQAAYDTATYHQVVSGIGYCRIETDYVDDDSQDQEIYIRRVANPLSIYLDPDIQQYDGSDARFAFVFKDMPRDEFEDEYRAYKDDLPEKPFGESNGWNDEDHVRVCEYFRIVTEHDTLIFFADGSKVRKSEVPKGALDWLAEERGGELGQRKWSRNNVEWYLIGGDRILDRRDWPGQYVPIIRFVGEETVIDGKLDRKGHVRALKDPQRMYNYASSTAVETVALQPKVPFIGTAQAIEGFESEWKTANTVPHSVLLYNAYDDQGRQLAPPQRAAPAQAPAASVEMAKLAAEEMRMVSGQYQAVMGSPSNETSGVAIQQRQRQGDTATYHYIDHHGQAIRFLGRIIIDLIPHIYDTKRVITVLGQDRSDKMQVELDPEAPEVHQQIQDPKDKEHFDPQQVSAILNPTVGRYEVEADIGPAFATRRQEAFNAISGILSQNRELTAIVGDLLFKAADFPMADEVAERLERMVPAQARGGPSPELQQVQQQAQQMHQQMQATMGTLVQQLAEAQRKLTDKGADQDRQTYEAETRRIAAVGQIDPAAMLPIIRQMVSEVLGGPALPVIHAHQEADAMLQQSLQPAPEAAQAAE